MVPESLANYTVGEKTPFVLITAMNGATGIYGKPFRIPLWVVTG
jgi:hypothetical protein